MLAAGESVPHFDIRTLGGSRVRYADIWQKRNLLLVALPAGAPDAERYASAAADAASACAALEADCLVTSDGVPGVDAPGVVIADRWGEVVYASHAPSAGELPAFDQLLEWLQYVQYRCPECEGEAR